jgi:hypothetical protein
MRACVSENDDRQSCSLTSRYMDGRDASCLQHARNERCDAACS